MKAQGQSLDELPFRAVLGVYGSYFGLIMNVLCIIAQFYIAVAPIGGSPNAYDFFVNMLALPIIIVCYVGWKVWFRTSIVRAHEADLLSGRRETDLAEAKRLELEERAHWRWYQRYIPECYDTNLLGCTISSAEMKFVSIVIRILVGSSICTFTKVYFSFLANSCCRI